MARASDQPISWSNRPVSASSWGALEYALTPLGRTLLDPVGGLVQWVEEHGRAVLDHRAAGG